MLNEKFIFKTPKRKRTEKVCPTLKPRDIFRGPFPKRKLKKNEEENKIDLFLNNDSLSDKKLPKFDNRRRIDF